jgi:polyphosphate kinase 2
MPRGGFPVASTTMIHDSDATAGLKQPAPQARSSIEMKNGRKDKAKPAEIADPAAEHRLARVLAFDIEAAKLPKAVRNAAFRSGGYPYAEEYADKAYEAELQRLQIELLKLQSSLKDTRRRLVVVFEGRDGAGKGGTIQRFAEHLNPRGCRIVALPKPSDAEAGQWYFQRYAAHLPTGGEIALYDRSWYNRAGVERVFGFTPADRVEAFLRDAPAFERLLVEDGVVLIKLFLSIGREMQMTRLHERWHDPLKRWKLSPLDFEAIDRWDAYSAAFDEMLSRTDHEAGRWTIVLANDKRRARLEAIRVVLSAIDYAGKDAAVIGRVDDRIVLEAQRFLRAGGEPESSARPAAAA